MHLRPVCSFQFAAIFIHLGFSGSHGLTDENDVLAIREVCGYRVCFRGNVLCGREFQTLTRSLSSTLCCTVRCQRELLQQENKLSPDNIGEGKNVPENAGNDIQLHNW